MSYRMFLDDERMPASNGWHIVRSSSDAIACVLAHGLPSRISFDHDLGGEDTAMRFVHFLVDYIIDNGLRGMVPDYTVHSQNPVGAANIKGMMDFLIKHYG